MDGIYAGCSALASQIHAGAASNVNWAARIGQQLEGPLAANTLPPVTPITFTEDTGLNWDWTVTIQWRIDNPTIVQALENRNVTRNFGGSVQTQNTTGTTSQDSASATVSTGERSGAEGSATAGTQNGTSTTNQQQVTQNGGGSTTGTEGEQTYQADLMAVITIQGSPNFSGSDYVNPFKWGYAGAGAISQAITGSSKTGTYPGGRIKYWMVPM